MNADKRRWERAKGKSWRVQKTFSSGPGLRFAQPMAQLTAQWRLSFALSGQVSLRGASNGDAVTIGVKNLSVIFPVPPMR
ncbi:MAG: hypothetical protein P4N60_24545 [Verrucomicrobiae bacterium]|nr:hypothetical protein [Verrucomicrobiae bacterium]